MSKKNVSRYVLLGLLDGRPMSGYDIKKIVEFSISDFWSESYGNIYPTLRKFLTDGLAEKTVEKQEGKPDRIVYNITPSGRKELVEWLNEPYKQRHVRDEFLVKLLFGHLLPIEITIHFIETYQQSLEERIGWYRESVANLKKQEFSNRKDLLEYLALRQGLLVLESRLNWCEEALNTLQEQNKN
ncbi:MAG: hypothetical protein A2V66_01325 [Ignavibacteria bacterium RBG_13_36_8]|nr:MAG: hypothetical protein A2V66_01325 [Ignavibacteria bacterium RBG_13_36_8]